jgi:hypothetical protein
MISQIIFYEHESKGVYCELNVISAGIVKSWRVRGIARKMFGRV